MSTASNALFVGREVGSAGGGLLRAMFRIPAVFALACWLAYAAFAGIHAGIAAQPVQVREVRAQCTLGPSDEITAPGRKWGTCQPGTGEVIMTTTNDLTRVGNTMALGAVWFQRAAMVFTIGAGTVLTSSLLGHRGYRRWERPRPVASTVAHVQDGQARARRDVAKAKARLGKVGESRRTAWAKRWSRQAAGDEPYSEPGRVDRWLIRQTKPPRSRKADKAAKRIGKASKRHRDQAIDAEWTAELGAAEPHLNPLDGPPLSPTQKADYADRLAVEAQATRDRLAAETAELFEGTQS